MRLTIEMRKSITKQIVERVYPPKDLDNIIDKIKNLFEAEDEVKYRAKVAKEYPRFIYSSDSLRIIVSIRNRYNSRYVNLSEPIACNAQDHDLVVRHSGLEVYGHGFLYSTKKTDKLIEKYEEIVNAADKFTKEVSAICESCTSTKQLKELIPEAAEFIPEDFKKIITNAIVPISAVDAIREKLGAVNGRK